ncbi:MAG: hypothetical protein R2769_12090 [Saprospiraceae bacterium]
MVVLTFCIHDLIHPPEKWSQPENMEAYPSNSSEDDSFQVGWGWYKGLFFISPEDRYWKQGHLSGNFAEPNKTMADADDYSHFMTSSIVQQDMKRQTIFLKKKLH